MRHLALAACAAFVGAAAAEPPAPEKDRGIRDWMRVVHAKDGGARATYRQLDQLLVSGRSTAAERKAFSHAYTEMRGLKPPQGTVESWRYDIDRILVIVKSLDEASDEKARLGAGDALLRATDCAACHEKYRYAPRAGKNEPVPKSLAAGLRAVAAGGECWSAPEKLDLPGTKYLQPGRRLVVWPAEDVVYEAKRVDNDHATVIVRFKWALRPGAEFPPSESKTLWYVTFDLGNQNRFSYHHAKPDMAAREGEFTEHLTVSTKGRPPGEHELVFVPQYSSWFSDNVAASNLVKLKYRLPK
jgi:hypothetical protein